MKLLHLGKKGNVDKYTTADDFTRSVEVISIPMQANIEDILAVASDADFLLADAMSTVPGKLIENLPNLKLIQSEGVGFQSFDIKEAKEKGIYVCNARGMNAKAVAEHALMLMVGVLRDVIGGDRAVRSGQQIIVKENYMVEGNLLELSDLTVGLYGFGAIAKELARFLSVMGAKVNYYDIFRANEEVEKQYNVSYLPLEDLLSSSDIISLHIPVTKENIFSVNDAFFAKMKDGSYIINTARGELIDSEALIKAIKTGKIARAGLDTISGEPVQKDNILINQPEEIASHLLFSPHIAGITASSFRRGYEIAWKNIKLVASGKKPLNVVNGL